MQFVEHDLRADGFGLPWGHTRSYANVLSVNSTGLNGNSWLVRQWKTLLFVDVPFGQNDPAQICIVDSGNSSLWFQRQSDGTYRPQFGENDILVHDNTNSQFTWTDQRGWQTIFHDNSLSQPVGLVGKLKAIIDPAGRRTDATYDGSGQLLALEQAAEGQTTRFAYDYVLSGTLAGLLARVSLLVNDRPVRRASYGYYAGESGGNTADLRSVVTEQYDPGTVDWRPIARHHYRYYVSGESGGFVHGLKYAIRGAAYQRMLEAGLDPETAPVTELAQYADFYFEYDSEQRVALEKIEGGRKVFSFTYEVNPSAPGFGAVNTWATRTVETLPDGSQNRVYSNQAGQTLLHILRSASGAQWCRYSQYDSEFHLILQASPSAIASVTEPVLPGSPALTVTLKTSEGLIREQVFYSTTNPTTGAVAGRLDKVTVKKGSGGTPIVLRHVEYTTQTAFGQTIYPLRAEEIYPQETTANPARTTYSYTWQLDESGAQTFQILEKTTTYPAVPATENGSSTAGVERVVFDRFGKPIWLCDPRGAITYRAYDVATGAVLQQIEDVDTARVTDAPPGWATVPGWGLHLISDYVNDALGRRVQARGPWHEVQLREKDTAPTSIRRVQFTAYLDEAHEVRQATGYQAGQSPTAELMTVGSVRLIRTDDSGRVTDEIQAVRTCSCGPLTTEEPFPQEKWSRWQHADYDTWGRLYARRVYHRIPTQGEGEEGANFLETIYGYDVMGRQNCVIEPSGTIRRMVYDVRGLIVSNWTGTDDRGATANDPTGAGATGNNMKLVSAQEYDGGSPGGDGNLTKATQPVDTTTANDRITTYTYDFRDRRVTTSQTDGTTTWVTATTYDNLDRPLQNSTSVSGGNLIAQSRTFYDLLGRIYRQETDGVDPATGNITNALASQSWYDLGTNVIKASQAGTTSFTKTVYDALNRPTVNYIACRPGTAGVPSGDDNNISPDTVLEQTETAYDRGGNIVLSTRRQRFDDATGLGALRDVNHEPKARVNYTASWPDAVGRLRVTADYGTNGGAALTRPPVAPARSDTVLVTTNRYKDNGDANAIVDPQGLETRWENDQAGRRVKLIENYVEADPDRSRISAYGWHASGQLERLILSNSETGEQVTRWVYGTTLTESQVSDNNLLRAKIYPESDDRPAPLDAGPDGVYARLEYTYNRQGQSIQFTDADGTVHQYAYDKLGRLLSDAVSTLGPDLDGAVLRIQRVYEVRGMLAKVTSYNAASGGSVVNESAFTYDAFGNLTLDRQSHTGIVTGTTPAVAYTYANGSANTVRRTSTVYPDGRILQVFYGSTNSIDDHLSRVSKLQFQGETIPLVEYTYVGVAWQVRVGYAGPAVELTYKKQGTEPVGDSGDPYNGYDRFGRTQDIRWQTTT